MRYLSIYILLSILFLSSCSFEQKNLPKTMEVAPVNPTVIDEKVYFTGSLFDSLVSNSGNTNIVTALPKGEKNLLEDSFGEWKNIYQAKSLWSVELQKIDKKYNETLISIMGGNKTTELNEIKKQRTTLLNNLKTSKEYIEHIKKNEKRLLELNEILRKYKPNGLTQEEFEEYISVQK